MKSTRFLVLFLASLPAFAQLASDEVPHQRTLPISEQVRQQLTYSRWRFGAFRVQPAFAIRDFGYDNNVYGTPTDEVADWRSTASAGVRGILPIGPKLYLLSNVVPEYTYYRKLTNRRSFGGQYDASVLALFNRMRVQARAATFKGLSPVTSEVERAAIGRRADLMGSVELDVLRRLSLFGREVEQRQRYSDTADANALGTPLGQLERNDASSRVGVRYRVTSFLDISAAAEHTRTKFVIDRSKDNTTKAALFGIHYDHGRSFINLSVGDRTGEATNLSGRFPRFSTTTGSYYASHELAVGIVFDAYGHRGIGYSLTLENPYYVETRNAVGLTLPLGHRLALRGFGETGTNSYPNLVQSIKRTDDVKSYGGGFALKLYRNLALVALASDMRYSSNIPGASRSIFRITTSISAQGGFSQ